MMTPAVVTPAKTQKVTPQRSAGVKPMRPAVFQGARKDQMLVWTPFDNKFFETLSYLPALTSDEIARQVDYITRNGWTPCLEFAESADAYVDSRSCNRMANGITVNYFDNRYWTMWKLPMFGCNDSYQVLDEIRACEETFPDSYIRLVGFDSIRQVQVAGFLVHRPPSSTDYQSPDRRSVAGRMGGMGGGMDRRGGGGGRRRGDASYDW